MSNVVPEGTAMLLKTIVLHEVLLFKAEAASVKVHVVALSSNLAGVVGVGAGTAATKVLPTLKRRLRQRSENMLKEVNGRRETETVIMYKKRKAPCKELTTAKIRTRKTKGSYTFEFQCMLLENNMV